MVDQLWWANNGGTSVGALPCGPSVVGQLWWHNLRSTSRVDQHEWSCYGGTTLEVLPWWTDFSGPVMVVQP